MASGAAAARTVKHACEKGDFSEATLAVYRDFLDEEGLVETQREARQAWQREGWYDEIRHQYPDPLLRIASRYFNRWLMEEEEHPYSLWGDLYHSLVKPVAPWYVRWPLGLATWMDTLRWRRRQARK